MRVTEHEQALIHECMKMSYEQGVEDGMKMAMQLQNETEHADDIKDSPLARTLANYESEREYDKEDWRLP